MSKANTWKLQDAKARFSEVVRRARAGEPQEVTVHGRKAVVVVDADRFEVKPKAPPVKTMAEFIERSKKYRGAAEGIDFEPRPGMSIKPRPVFFDDDET
jgi:prevent-host-death family protein